MPQAPRGCHPFGATSQDRAERGEQRQNQAIVEHMEQGGDVVVEPGGDGPHRPSTAVTAAFAVGGQPLSGKGKAPEDCALDDV
eukprot:966549-Lingulodinium_polyedra.AAC.1